MLQDHIERRNIDLGSLQFRILDEADEMLRMGFVDDVELILGMYFCVCCIFLGGGWVVHFFNMNVREVNTLHCCVQEHLCLYTNYLILLTPMCFTLLFNLLTIF